MKKIILHFWSFIQLFKKKQLRLIFLSSLLVEDMHNRDTHRTKNKQLLFNFYGICIFHVSDATFRDFLALCRNIFVRSVWLNLFSIEL